jgi:hypothetical protein
MKHHDQTQSSTSPQGDTTGTCTPHAVQLVQLTEVELSNVSGGFRVVTYPNVPMETDPYPGPQAASI